MAGLPFTRLPGSDMTPEGILKQRTEEGQQRIQQEFQFEWDSINRRAKAEKLSRKQHQKLLADLQVTAQRRAREFTQKIQMDTNNLIELDRLAEARTIPDVAKAKWRIVLGPEAEEAMFPKQARRKTPMEQYRDLDLYREKLMRRKAETFRMRDPWYGKPRLEIRRDPYTDKWTSDLTKEEGEFAANLDIEIDRITKMQDVLLRPGQETPLMRTALTSPRMTKAKTGGAIRDQVRAYLDQQTVERQQEPEDLSDDEVKYNELIRRGWRPEQIEQALGR